MSDIKSLSKINLNLLVPLKVLLDTQSVTSAAEALKTTQPTMSRHLAALRDLFNDKLLVRVGNGYQLTPKAVEIRKDLENLVEDLSDIFTSGFSHCSDAREFVIACPDLAFNYALVDAVKDYLNEDNALSFNVLNWDQRSRQLLLEGAIDFALSIEEDFGANFIRKRIDSGDWVCVLRKGHPLLQVENPIVEDCLRYSFARVSSGGGSDKALERYLKKRKVNREIKLTTQSYLKMFSALQASDLLAFVLRHQAEIIQDDFDLTYIEFPLSLPKVYWALYWHEKHNDDEAHRWLREHIFPKLMSHKGLTERKPAD